MGYPEDFDRAAKIAAATMAHMKMNGIEANPNNFKIWYEFFSGTNAALKRSLQPLLADQKRFTQSLNDEIYERFFGSVDDSERTAALQQQIESIAQRMTEALENTGKGTEQYGEALRAFSGNLQNANEDGGFTNLVSGILAETKAMASHMAELKSRVRSSTDEIDSLKAELEDARRESVTDGLTGIANRRSFDLRLRAAATEATQSGQPLTLILCDLDHFKSFNDTHGHQVGDQVLKIVGKTLTGCVKGQDTAARYGGEEFAVILPNTSVGGAVSLAEQIRRTVAQKKLLKRGSDIEFGPITLSLGVSQYVPGEPVSRLIERADRALYRAKEQGRNRVVTDDRSSPHLAASA